MKIAVFSLGPIFNGQVHGGSQKALRDIAVGLGKKGHEIVIFCPKRDDNNEIFKFSDNVTVKPIIPFKGTYPAPYEVGPFKIYKACEILGKEVSNFHLLYIHDAELNIEFLKDNIPTVISLRDFCYGETLLGAINFNQSEIIVNSNHTYTCLLDSFSRINSNIKTTKVSLIHNGYDPIHFKRKKTFNNMYNKLGLPPKGDYKMIGFPHRPDLVKGFLESIEVIDKLVKEGVKVKLLIPEYMDTNCSSRSYETYSRVMKMINDKDLADNIIFHKWVPHELMPEYYSYCDVVLCIGNFCEAFSNVSTESLLCETPVIATNTATYRTMPIRSYVDIVDYGDIDQTVERVKLLLEKRDTKKLSDARKYIIENLSIEKCVDAFESVFERAIKNFIPRENKILNFKNCNILDRNAKYHLSPWCYYLKNAIYNDYLYGLYADNLNMIYKDNGDFYIDELEKMGLSMDRIEKAIEDGVILREWIN